MCITLMARRARCQNTVARGIFYVLGMVGFAELWFPYDLAACLVWKRGEVCRGKILNQKAPECQHLSLSLVEAKNTA